MTRLKDIKNSRRRKLSRKQKNGLGCLGCFGIIWMLFVLGFDGFIGYGFWRTYDARARFLTTPGVVTGSEIERSSSSEGTTYSAKVEYEFVLNGTSYTGDRHSFFSFGTSSSEHANAIVRRYPVGQAVTVYYDPSEPGQSVLEVDTRSFPAIVILFLTPFHCIGIGFLLGGVGQVLRERRGKEEVLLGLHRVHSGDGKLVLEDSHWRGWVVFLMTLGITSFISVFVVAFLLGVGTGRETVLWIWSGCVLAAMTLPTIVRLRRMKRQTRLEIDWLHSRFTRKPGSINVDIGDIKTIRLTIHDTSTSVNNQPWYRHEIEGVESDGTAHLLLVVRGYQARGEQLRDWFAERFEAAVEELPEGERATPSMPMVSEVEINRTNT